MPSEKRSFPRVPLSVSVTYRVNRQERVEAYRVESVNVSEEGVFLKTDLPLGIGTEVELEFALPGGADPLRVVGRVAWSGVAGGGAGGGVLGKGIRFTECDARCRELLARYVGGRRSAGP